MFYDQKVSASMRERKKLDFNLSLKSIDNQGIFAGYASVFNMVDNQRDVIQRGAFSRTLKGRIGDIKLLWQHQQDEPIGVFSKIFEDTRGLYVEAKLLLNVQRALEAHTLLKAGALSGSMSPSTAPMISAKRSLTVTCPARACHSQVPL